jgi:hypothetical protein
MGRAMHPLHEILVAAADGRFPSVDGSVEVLPPDADGHHAVVELTGHSYVLTDRDVEEVRAWGVDGYGGASRPDVLRRLAGRNGWIGSHDAVLVARGTGAGVGGLRPRSDLDDHPRVARARRHRRDVVVFADETGLLTLGRGLVGRLELSVELLPPATVGAGAGRRLVAAGVGLVPAGELVWAQVAPGNAASLRVFLNCGFVPVGAETLFTAFPGHAGRG